MIQRVFNIPQALFLRAELRPNEAYQRQPNRLDSLKFRICFEFEICDLRFICDLEFEIWNLYEIILGKKVLLIQSEFNFQ